MCFIGKYTVASVWIFSILTNKLGFEGVCFLGVNLCVKIKKCATLLCNALF